MNKEDIKKEIIKLFTSDFDENSSILANEMEKYQGEEFFEELYTELYSYISKGSKPLEFTNKDETMIEDTIKEALKYYELGRFVSSIECLEKIQKVVDSFLEVEYDDEKMEVCSFENGIEYAIYFYLGLDPDKDIYELPSFIARYYTLLAMSYQMIEDYNKAISYFDIVLELNYASNKAHFYKALAYYKLNDYPKTLEMLENYSKYAYEVDLVKIAYYMLGEINASMKNYELAAVLYSRSLQFFDKEELIMQEILLKFFQYKEYITIDIEDQNEVYEYLYENGYEIIPNDEVFDILYTLFDDIKNSKYEDERETAILVCKTLLDYLDDEKLEKYLALNKKDGN